MIKELKIGDYIGKSEIDTEQKYNDVVEVFEQEGLSGYGAFLDYHSVMSDSFPLIYIKDSRFMPCGYGSNIKRKLTYDQIMSLKKHQTKDTKVSIVNRDIERGKGGKIDDGFTPSSPDGIESMHFNESIHIEKRGATMFSVADDGQLTNQINKDGGKYHREIIGFCGTKVEVDVYRVLDAYPTKSSSVDHAIKKLLCTGLRGHKDYLTDLDNAIESLQEARLLHLQKLDIELS